MITTNGFRAVGQMQRPGLLLANGNVYAGFGSFCDLRADVSRGWLLGWQAGSLTPLAGNQLFDQQPTSPNSFFLSSIWMSGYGLADDDAGNIVFVTGNSDYSGTTYDGVTNIQESVVKVSPDLTTVLDLFTPKNQAVLDQTDADFGSGGAMVLPDQAGSYPHLVIAAGKTGGMFLMNGDDLGGYSTQKNNVLATANIGECWCGQSYFVDGRDNLPRIVSSGGSTAMVWKLRSSPAPGLQLMASSASLGGGQFGGFFTSVSSNGTDGAIIWALSRPNSSSDDNLYLYAFNGRTSGSTLQQLFRARAGTWPNLGGDSNQVPAVANGRVFVTSYKRLAIFGLKAAEKKK